MSEYDAAIVALKALVAAQDIKDPEAAHLAADNILREFLTALGFAGVVEAYDKIEKWYA